MNVEATSDVISAFITTSYAKAINTIYNFIIYNVTIYLFITYIISNNFIPSCTIFLVIICCRYKSETTCETKYTNKTKNYKNLPCRNRLIYTSFQNKEFQSNLEIIEKISEFITHIKYLRKTT